MGVSAVVSAGVHVHTCAAAVLCQHLGVCPCHYPSSPCALHGDTVSITGPSTNASQMLCTAVTQNMSCVTACRAGGVTCLCCTWWQHIHSDGVVVTALLHSSYPNVDGLIITAFLHSPCQHVGSRSGSTTEATPGGSWRLHWLISTCVSWLQSCWHVLGSCGCLGVDAASARRTAARFWVFFDEAQTSGTMRIPD